MDTETTTDTVRVSAIIPAPPERIYGAWLDSREHSAITRSTATIEAWVGGRHSAWGGSIRGTTLDLQPGRRIVQSWYASDFPPGSEDSRLEVLFEPIAGGTLVTLNHTGLPAGRGHRYEDGWRDYYLDHMKTYFIEHPTAPEADDEPRATPPRAEPAAAAKAAGTKPAARKAAAPKPAKRTKAATARARRKPVAKKAKATRRAKAKPKPRKGVAKRTAKRKPARAALRRGASKRKTSGRASSRRSR